MSELEQLRQEAEQLRNQIRVRIDSKVLEKLVSGLKVTSVLPLLISTQCKRKPSGVDVISTSPISLLPVEFIFLKTWIPPYVLICC
uniref:Uncharacterized protein n=1 Tax=Strix occidentalis caurina TaxID=311401 RepID=A0A8D0FRS3_STROC